MQQGKGAPVKQGSNPRLVRANRYFLVITPRTNTPHMVEVRAKGVSEDKQVYERCETSMRRSERESST